jgi:DNA-binding GntR family transcriptional regulator
MKQSKKTITPKEIIRIRKFLALKPRDLLLFDMATQTGLPAEHWLQLKIKHLSHLKIGDLLPIQSWKSQKSDAMKMNTVLKKSFDYYLKESNAKVDDFLFQSRKGGTPLTLSSVSRIIKKWFLACDIIIPKGLLALRKIWEDYYRVENENHHIRKGQSNLSSLTPIKVPTRQEVVYKELEKAILSGKILPGERIIAEEIAKKLNVSKSPVREALGRLEARGFISLKPNWGHTVNELSQENLKEILELRINLECLAAKKALPNCTNDVINKLKHYHERFNTAQKKSESEEMMRLNKLFHYTLYQQAQAPILQNLIDHLWDRVSPYYHIMARQSLKPNPFAGIQVHGEIIQALMSKNEEKVVNWLKKDLTNSAHFMISLFDLYNNQ